MRLIDKFLIAVAFINLVIDQASTAVRGFGGQGDALTPAWSWPFWAVAAIVWVFLGVSLLWPRRRVFD